MPVRAQIKKIARCEYSKTNDQVLQVHNPELCDGLIHTLQDECNIVQQIQMGTGYNTLLRRSIKKGTVEQFYVAELGRVRPKKMEPEKDHSYLQEPSEEAPLYDPNAIDDD